MRADEFFKLLYGIRNAEFLKLNTGFFQALVDADLLKHRNCSFGKLKSLKLLVDSSPPSGLSIPPEIMTCLLAGTPHPQNVDIKLQQSLSSTSLDLDNPCGLVDW
ncbi:hypothetical protein Tsubulata_035034 [Turnera subulata]|uniref:Uncharacterized protein n=1 Tax=Turnera subulata TaxID=218843 RepID=A0A9Q0FYA8_9ROSI|nr:hypothetical protein Tsubulata_035034 [Turnera subulata]